jgi:hypothetical protein
MYIPALPALLVTALATRPSIEPRDAAGAALCTRTTVTNYAKTHEVVKTYTGTMTILHTETETVYSPTSGVPKATRASCFKITLRRRFVRSPAFFSFGEESHLGCPCTLPNDRRHAHAYYHRRC